jgi:CheY-like chemotaxis protein
MTALQPTRPRNKQQELREKYGKLRLLLAASDRSTGTMTRQILFPFRFGSIEMVTDGEAALDMLRKDNYDLVMTDPMLSGVDGVQMTRAVRSARPTSVMKRDTPVMLLTGDASIDTVHRARDSGVNEIIVRPFSVTTLQTRLAKAIDSPRKFVASLDFMGPCRRRQGKPPPGVEDRRGKKKPYIVNAEAGDLPAEAGTGGAMSSAIHDVIGRDDMLGWAMEGVSRLERIFHALRHEPTDLSLHEKMLSVTQEVKVLSAQRHYHLGEQICSMLGKFIAQHRLMEPRHLTVIGKHIEAILVIFSQTVKNTGQELANELIRSLNTLIAKFQ